MEIMEFPKFGNSQNKGEIREFSKIGEFRKFNNNYLHFFYNWWKKAVGNPRISKKKRYR